MFTTLHPSTHQLPEYWLDHLTTGYLSTIQKLAVRYSDGNLKQNYSFNSDPVSRSQRFPLAGLIMQLIRYTLVIYLEAVPVLFTRIISMCGTKLKHFMYLNKFWV